MKSVQSVSPPSRPADSSFSGRQGVRRRRHAIILLKVFEHRLRELMRERPHRRAFEKLAFLQQGAQPAHTEFMVAENRASHRAQGRTIAVSSGEHHTGILAISSPYARRLLQLNEQHHHLFRKPSDRSVALVFQRRDEIVLVPIISIERQACGLLFLREYRTFAVSAPLRRIADPSVARV